MDDETEKLTVVNDGELEVCLKDGDEKHDAVTSLSLATAK